MRTLGGGSEAATPRLDEISADKTAMSRINARAERTLLLTSQVNADSPALICELVRPFTQSDWTYQHVHIRQLINTRNDRYNTMAKAYNVQTCQNNSVQGHPSFWVCSRIFLGSSSATNSAFGRTCRPPSASRTSSVVIGAD